MFSPTPQTQFSKFNTVSPSGIYKFLKRLWRSKSIVKDIRTNNIDVYHGLSNELPFGIDKLETKTVVTIHDLINKRYPQHYSFIDRIIYHKKVSYAQKIADKIIVPSQQTKDDLVYFFKTEEKKIKVIPLSIPQKQLSQASKVKSKYILCVSSFTKRKNLENLVIAFNEIETADVKLIVAGKKGRNVQQCIIIGFK